MDTFVHNGKLYVTMLYTVIVGIIAAILYYLLLLRKSVVTGLETQRDDRQQLSSSSKTIMDTQYSRTLSRMGIIFVFGVGYLLLLLGRNTTAARSSTTTTCDECVSGKNDGGGDSHKNDKEDHGNSGKLYPIQTFFVNTGEGQADEMAHQFAKYGKYHNYLNVNQIKSKFCLGHCYTQSVNRRYRIF